MATDYYVDSSRPDDSGDGESWALAKKHISAAITTAVEDGEIGLLVKRKSILQLVGDNYIENSEDFGVVCKADSLISIAPWEEDATRLTTKIKTTEPRKDYTALKVMVGAAVVLNNLADSEDKVETAYLQIVQASDFKGAGYFGVVLESKSLLVGADQIYFTETGVNDDDPTVPEGQRILANQAEGTTVVY